MPGLGVGGTRLFEELGFAGHLRAAGADGRSLREPARSSQCVDPGPGHGSVLPERITRSGSIIFTKRP
jgi:hypothetical protein